MSAAATLFMRHALRRVAGLMCCVAFAGCSSLTRPHYLSPDVHVGEPAFVRALEAHTLSGLVDGNRAEVLLNGDEIFPAMLAAVRSARTTITFAAYMYEEGAIAREMTEALAERCRAGVGVNLLLDAVGSTNMPKRPSSASTTATTGGSSSWMAAWALPAAPASEANGPATAASPDTGARPTCPSKGRSCASCRRHSSRTGATEYAPAMLHAKTLVVDGQWVTIGSANIDNRSFQLNSELNVAFLDRPMAQRLTAVFDQLQLGAPTWPPDPQAFAVPE